MESLHTEFADLRYRLSHRFRFIFYFPSILSILSNTPVLFSRHIASTVTKIKMERFWEFLTKNTNLSHQLASLLSLGWLFAQTPSAAILDEIMASMSVCSLPICCCVFSPCLSIFA